MNFELPILQLKNITKSFAGNFAVKDLNLDFNVGEIHSLVGENGAGKSTLMKICAGIYAPDGGEILLDGKPIRFAGYDAAQKAGVGLVYQELSLLPQMSVAENIFMGVWKSRFGLIKWKKLKEEAREALVSIGADIDPSLLVESLSMAQRQMVEIVKVLIQNPRIIIFDEPTTALSAEEATRLFTIMQGLKKKGRAVVFISHRLKEVLQASDRVTVMKDGVKVVTENISYFNEEKIISLMIGREITDIYPPKAHGGGKEIFSFSSSVNRFGKSVKFSVKEGEVLGIGGLTGQGQDEMLESMFGIGDYGKPAITLNGTELKFDAPSRAIASGIALVPQDRNRQGTFGILSIQDNISAATLKHRQLLGFIRRREERSAAFDMTKKLDIRALSPAQECRLLSGGNMQKVVLGKWLLSNPKIMILLSPTSGIDIGTKQQIYHLIRDLAAKGIVIIMLSSDMIELIGLCDRVLVMSSLNFRF
ncbi:ribose import ATP-binding protein RbsA [Synergistales bacterium]|nr:ribose import ATP-binding protein RbsA [Synergistales bacterium]